MPAIIVPDAGTLPQVGVPPASPIVIDPGVDYPYVIPVYKETSISFDPVAGFAAELVGRTLTVRYTRVVPINDADFTFVITCSNAKGDTQHRVTFRVPGTLRRQTVPSFYCTFTGGHENISFGSVLTIGGFTPAESILDRIKVGTKLYFGAHISGVSCPEVENQTVYVVAVDDSLGFFKVSATLGGDPLELSVSTAYRPVIFVAKDTQPEIYVGDTSLYVLGDPVSFSFNDGTVVPASLAGGKFVKQIVDRAWIKVSNTLGGAAVNADDDFQPTDADSIFISDSSGARHYPAIDCDSEISAAEEVAIADYTVTSDLDGIASPPTFTVQGLPSGLTYSAATKKITGTPFNLSVQTRIKIIAILGSFASYRYLLINAPTASDLEPDAVFDVNNRNFYSLDGFAGRGDRLERYLNDPPIRWGFEQNGVPFTIPAGSIVSFFLKKKIEDADTIASGTRTLTVDRDSFNVGEDYTNADLVAALGTEKYVDLVAQLQVQLPGDPGGTARKGTIAFRLWQDEAQAGTGATGTAPATFNQVNPYTALTGGTSNALATYPTVNLALDKWLAKTLRTVDGAKVSGDWALVAWDTVTAAADDATSSARSITIPDDFNAGTNAKMWVRTQGL